MRRFVAAPKRGMSLLIASLAMLSLMLAPSHIWGQATVSTGSIVGTVSDPSGASVPGAKVMITNTGTSATVTSTTNGAGVYNSGAAAPGEL